MRQFILHLNDTKIADKKFILENIDANHLLIKADARDEIARKVEEWMDMVRSSSLRTWIYLLFMECGYSQLNFLYHLSISQLECLFVCREGWWKFGYIIEE